MKNKKHFHALYLFVLIAGVAITAYFVGNYYQVVDKEQSTSTSTQHEASAQQTPQTPLFNEWDGDIEWIGSVRGQVENINLTQQGKQQGTITIKVIDITRAEKITNRSLTLPLQLPIKESGSVSNISRITGFDEQTQLPLSISVNNLNEIKVGEGVLLTIRPITDKTDDNYGGIAVDYITISHSPYQ